MATQRIPPNERSILLLTPTMTTFQWQMLISFQFHANSAGGEIITTGFHPREHITMRSLGIFRQQTEDTWIMAYVHRLSSSQQQNHQDAYPLPRIQDCIDKLVFPTGYEFGTQIVNLRCRRVGSDLGGYTTHPCLVWLTHATG